MKGQAENSFTLQLHPIKRQQCQNIQAISCLSTFGSNLNSAFRTLIICLITHQEGCSPAPSMPGRSLVEDSESRAPVVPVCRGLKHVFVGLRTFSAKIRTVSGKPGWLFTLNVKEDWERALDRSRRADTICLVASWEHEGLEQIQGSEIMMRQRSPWQHPNSNSKCQIAKCLSCP